jgi:hypothetical protein
MFGIAMFGIARYVALSGFLDVATRKPVKFAFWGPQASSPDQSRGRSVAPVLPRSVEGKRQAGEIGTG